MLTHFDSAHVKSIILLGLRITSICFVKMFIVEISYSDAAQQGHHQIK